MLLLSTFEAERISAKTVDNLGCVHDSLCRIVTFFGKWAPLDSLIVVCERLAVPSHVLFIDCRIILE